MTKKKEEPKPNELDAAKADGRPYHSILQVIAQDAKSKTIRLTPEFNAVLVYKTPPPGK